MPDWEAIQKEYEGGLSLRSLSAKHEVPTTTLHRHIQHGQWQRNTERNKAEHPLVFEQVQPPDSIAELAQKMVGQLANIALVPLALKEHKLFADSLSQYHKIIIAAPDQQLPNTIDWSIFEQAELDIIQPIFAAAEERKRIADGESGIPQLRKQG